jgi:hypothetical protein
MVSWAAHREITRMEDMVYCLLGIFRVHMAMLYEERPFLRHQEEIINTIPDLGIFLMDNAFNFGSQTRL